MAEITETISIARSPEEVWATLADFGAVSRWAPNVDHSCLTTEQADGVGVVRRVQVGRHALLERIVTWEPAQTLAYTIEGVLPVIQSLIATWRLTNANDGTIVSLTSDVDAGPRPPQQLVARAIAKVIARQSRQMLTGLKAHLEEEANR